MKTLPKQQQGDEFSPAELKETLLGLAQSKYWPAIKQYNRGRDVFISQSLRSLDPNKDATQIARVQGMSLGIYDMENGLQEELDRIEEESKGEEAGKSDKSSG